LDIHKPKPWRDWREFLKEYLIVVVGVLTALGAEQAVEWLHWRHVVAQGREAVAADQGRLLGWIGLREAQSKCLGAGLVELDHVLTEASRSGSLPPMGNVGGPGKLSWAMRGWDGIVSSDALSHFPQEEGARYEVLALQAANLRKVRDDEVDQWSVLRTMMGPARKLSDAEAANLRAALGRAASDAFYMRLQTRQMSELIQDTRLLSRKQRLEAWKYGVDHGGGPCPPLASRPVKTSYVELQALSSPPTLPEGSYEDDPKRPYVTRVFRNGGR
jgi:hypothetical protein